MKQRLDQTMAARGLVATRSQAESWIRLGKVFVDGKQVMKAGALVSSEMRIDLKASEQYVSRAGLKLASVAQMLNVDFKGKIVLDVGSSTGGFTDYALQHGAQKVVAVDVGTDQLHPSLRGNPKIILHEQTDIRKIVFVPNGSQLLGNDTAPIAEGMVAVSELPDIIVVDVSFISLRNILPHLRLLSSPRTQILAMVKPQFEAINNDFKHKGVIKNDRMRRDILKSFEQWALASFVILAKADSDVAGAHGNLERFYKLRKT